MTPNVKLNLKNIAVKLEKPVGSEVIEVFLNLPTSRVSSQLADVEYLQNVDALMTHLKVFATSGLVWLVVTFTRLEMKTVSCSKVKGGSYEEKP